LTWLKKSETINKELAETETLISSAADDEELRALAVEDLTRLTNEKAALEQKVKELMVPRDVLDSRDIILEIRAGAGGEEAALFASELFRAYTRYAELHGLKMHTLSTSFSEQNGFKEVIAELTGKKRLRHHEI